MDSTQDKQTDTAGRDGELRQKLAAIEHERWSDWHKWCHKVINENISYNKPLEIVMSRWDIQANKSYKNLSDSEKASDMEQVDRYWPLIQEYVTSATRTAVTEALDQLIDRAYEYGVSDVELIERRGEFLQAVPVSAIEAVRAVIAVGGKAS